MPHVHSSRRVRGSKASLLDGGELSAWASSRGSQQIPYGGPTRQGFGNGLPSVTATTVQVAKFRPSGWAQRRSSSRSISTATRSYSSRGCLMRYSTPELKTHSGGIAPSKGGPALLNFPNIGGILLLSSEACALAGPSR